MLGYIYLLIRKTVRNREVLNYALATTGIILMNLEPNSVFGSFQNSIGFWYMPYVIMTYRVNNKTLSSLSEVLSRGLNWLFFLILPSLLDSREIRRVATA